jgi:hypothetical protein
MSVIFRLFIDAASTTEIFHALCVGDCFEEDEMAARLVERVKHTVTYRIKTNLCAGCKNG